MREETTAIDRTSWNEDSLVMPRVSVITVFFNAERFLREAIESAIAQEYEDWELLLVDDGSTDRSSAIALEYAERIPQKIRYLHHLTHSNRGISASQNLGINNAHGEFIAFLDSDDVWMPNKLREQVRLLDRHSESALICGTTHYWYGWTGSEEDKKRDLIIPPGFKDESLVDPPSFLTRLLKSEIPVPCPSDVMVRRSAAVHVHGFEERFHHLFTDQAFYVKICLSSPVLISTRCWSRYRRHSESSTLRAKRQGSLKTARLDFLNWVEDYLASNETTDRDVWQALSIARLKTLWPSLSGIPGFIKYRMLLLREYSRQLAHLILPASIDRFLRTRVLNKSKAGLRSQSEHHV